MKIAVIAGDGIGPEVTHQALKVLRLLVPDVSVTEFDWGAQRYLTSGQILNEHDIAQLQNYDAIILGAIGDPRVPAGILERGFLLNLRFACDHHLNLRPARTYRGVSTPLASQPQIDILVVREGTEGSYIGNGGAIRIDTPYEIATETSINTRYGIERVVRAAFKYAQERSGKLTWVHKTNVLRYSGQLWQRTVDEVAQEFPHIKVGYAHIDAVTIYLMNQPEQFDVIVTDNLFGDIITDLIAAITGGIGLAASANVDSSGTHPPMFEPVHGSAPDIAGTNTADPIAAIASVVLLLRHLRREDLAEKLENAVEKELSTRGSAPLYTDQVGERICQFIIDPCS